MDQTPPSGAGPGQRRLFSTLKADVRTVADDMRKHGWNRQVGGTFKSLETFYLTDEDRQRLAAMNGFRRFFRRLFWLVRSLLLKLTPARRVMLAVALFALLIGVQEVRFQTADISFRFPALGSVLLLLVLMLELKDKLVAKDELEAGWKVQMALMPEPSPAVPGWDVWLYTKPANDVGGDLVDHLPIDERRHGIALGDVAGKALPAALLSVKLQATLRALAPRFEDLGAFGDAANQILERDGVPSRFASLVYLVVTTDSGLVRILNAGHMPPVILRGSAVETMDRGSVVLGIMPGATFFEQQVTLSPGDVLVAYSDGVSEAMNDADDFFGEERLHAVVRRAAGSPAHEMGARILEAVERFAAGTPPNDDVSLMILKRAATATAPAAGGRHS